MAKGPMRKVTPRQPEGGPCEAGVGSRRRFLRSAGLGALGIAATTVAFARSGSRAHASTSNPEGSRQKRSHEYFMRRAIGMAKKVPRFPFGVVIVRRATGEIVAEGFNRSSENPTFHGEIDAINRCAATRRSIDWTALDLYTTAEPCPMCQSAIEWAGISTVYYGTSIPSLQSHGWSQIDIRAEEVARRTPFRQTKVIGGILEDECNVLFDAAPKSEFKK